MIYEPKSYCLQLLHDIACERITGNVSKVILKQVSVRQKQQILYSVISITKKR